MKKALLAMGILPFLLALVACGDGDGAQHMILKDLKTGCEYTAKMNSNGQWGRVDLLKGTCNEHR